MPPRRTAASPPPRLRALAEAGWDNRPVESPTKSDKQIIRENIFTYFNLIFVVLAVCLLLVGDWKDMTFLLIVAANAVIGIVQQLKSQADHRKAVPALRRQGHGSSGTESSSSCRWTSWCGRTWWSSPPAARSRRTGRCSPARSR